MSSQDPRIEAIFHEALDRAPAEREAFVSEATEGDESLRREVLRLLAAHEEAGAYFEPPNSLEIDAELARLKPEEEGERIGRYKLLQEIGQGGFGTVWMAEQIEPVSRRVALKIIKIGMDTKKVIGRFEQERQALAMMDHPNIAKVFDAGATPFGRPYFVMELVKGIPITEFCDERQLDTRQRLELFADVCAAINHAHQKGVIHRDIKPSNVMITLHGDTAVVKVIDFGIAKATQGKLTDKTLFTRFEQFIGTPVYMSPEQAKLSGLDIDTRSDIYALGVLLYELLTGKPPFDAKSLVSAGYEEMRRIIREVEPPRPSLRLSTVSAEERTTLAKARNTEPGKLSRTVEPDLDWIVMKAIEKDRTRRYETANGLALDIHRFLANEPVSATPPSAGYRFRKFARRNKSTLGVAALIVTVMVAATAISTWQAVIATRAKELASDRLVDSEKARQEAEAISTFMTEIFKSPDPARDGRTITVAEKLNQAVEKLELDLADQPARRAKLQATLGRTYYALGLARESIPLREKVRDYHLATSGPEHMDTLRAMKDLAASYLAAGRSEEAIKLQQEVLALRRKVSGPEHLDTLTAMGNLASSYSEIDREDEALKRREELLAMCRRVLGPEHRETLGAMTNLAISYRESGRVAEAIRLLEAALPIKRRVLPRNDRYTFACITNLGLSYLDIGRRVEAIQLKEEALALRREVDGQGHPDTLLAMSSLASAYDLAGRDDDALKLKEEALAVHRRVLGLEHRQTLSAMTNLAAAYRDSGRVADAIKLLEETLPIKLRVLPPNDRYIRVCMSNLASAYLDAGRREEAIKLGEEVLAVDRKTLGLENRETLEDMTNLASAYDRIGRGEEALKLQEEVLPLCRKVLGPEDRDTLSAMINLAASYDEIGRGEEALKLQEEVLPLCRKVRGPEHRVTLGAMTNLASSYHELGRQDEALKLRQQVLTALRKAPGTEHRETLGAMTNLAISYSEAGRLDEAIKLLEEALPIKSRALPPNDPFLIVCMNNLVRAYAAAGRRDETIKLCEELLALSRKVFGPERPEALGTMYFLSDVYIGAGRQKETLKL